MIRSTSNTSSSEILPVSEPEFEAALMFPSQLMLFRHTESAFQYFRTLYCLVQHQKWKTFEKSQFSQWFDKSEFKWRKNTQNQKSKCLSTKKWLTRSHSTQLWIPLIQKCLQWNEMHAFECFHFSLLECHIPISFHGIRQQRYLCLSE